MENTTAQLKLFIKKSDIYHAISQCVEQAFFKLSNQKKQNNIVNENCPYRLQLTLQLHWIFAFNAFAFRSNITTLNNFEKVGGQCPSVDILVALKQIQQFLGPTTLQPALLSVHTSIWKWHERVSWKISMSSSSMEIIC